MRSLILLALIITCFQILECRQDGGKFPDSRLSFFDIDLLKYSVEDKKGNVMVSPVSIRNNLAMLLEGSAGDTAKEIRHALRLSPVKEDHRTELKEYLNTLQSHSAETTLQNANAIFVNNKLKLKKDYENVVQKVYNSQIEKVDFKNPTTAANLLNEWVKNNTNGHIPAIIQANQINSLTEVVIANALYFKSMWKHSFRIRNRGVCFFTYGVCNKVTMMELDVHLNYVYVRDLRAHAVELPYQGGRFSMILLVPLDRDGIEALVRDLPYRSLPEISQLMEPTEVRLSMPKFTVSYGEDIVGTLKNMRIRTLFEPKANLSGIFEGTQPHVTTIYHKVHMAVDENGTVAAAATVSNVVPLINSGLELRVDRPFLFFIRDDESGIVLFEGKIDNPVEYSATSKGVVNAANNNPLQDPNSSSAFTLPYYYYNIILLYLLLLL